MAHVARSSYDSNLWSDLSPGLAAPVDVLQPGDSPFDDAFQRLTDLVRHADERDGKAIARTGVANNLRIREPPV